MRTQGYDCVMILRTARAVCNGIKLRSNKLITIIVENNRRH